MSKIPYLVAPRNKGVIPITPVTTTSLSKFLKTQKKRTKDWVKSCRFNGSEETICLISDDKGKLVRVLAGVDRAQGPWAFSFLARALPAGTYKIEDSFTPEEANLIAMGWSLATYSFTRYKKDPRNYATLSLPREANAGAVAGAVEATHLVRDLINTPAGDLGPAELADAAKTLGKTHGAKVTITTGDALLKKDYPAIHAVGRAADEAPRLIDMRWDGPASTTKSKNPKITIVGKGVVFDSGGLDLKPPAAMKQMKKDMGGGAHALGLASMIMAAKLPVQLRVLVPAVENAVSGNAFRPLDVLPTRKGLTVEVGNTDAEGRLVLCDALAEASTEKPDLILDFATLTGAARVALGTELGALFSNDDEMASRLVRHAEKQFDPVWQMPLYRPYRRLLDSYIADMNNVSEGGFGGAITAALFLSEFVDAGIPWMHLDIMAWNNATRSGRPIGGEAMGMRAAFSLIEEIASQD